jgi:transcriptional regulator with XRE-family HTH domain
MARQQLGSFLRTRRARVRPADVGLTAGAGRRTPGLRREEVARLAGISVDYYTRLEQGRGPHPSRQVLSALARALRLDGDERAHLHHLAGEPPAPPTGPSPDVPAGVLRLLDVLTDTPAYVVDAKYDLLAWNPLAGLLLGDACTRPAEESNLIWRMFGDDDGAWLRDDPDADEFADVCVADLRAAAGRFPDDPGIARLLARLRAASPEFVRRWDEHQVAVRRGSRPKRVRHPAVGEMALECEVLEVAGHGQRLVLYTAPPGSPAAEALALLAVVGPQWAAVSS